MNRAAASGAWLLELPTQAAYRLPNAAYELTVRKRLGLLPHSFLLEEVCLSWAQQRAAAAAPGSAPCGGVCEARQCVRHAASQHASRRTGGPGSIGGSHRATSQPRLGTALVTVTNETSGEGRRELQDSGLRGDLLMALSAERILVDVTVPRATAMSDMHLPPGACVKGAELVVGQVSRSAAQRHTPVHHVSKTSSRASGVPVASLTLCPSSLGRDVCSFQPALSTRRLSPARGSTRARRHTLSAQCLSSQRQSTAGAQRAILPPSHPIS